MLIDTHSHLFYKNFRHDLDEVVNRATESGVDQIIVPATDLETAEQTISLCEKYDIVYGAAGIHPHDSKDWNYSLLTKIQDLAQHKKIIAIGEIGLDYYYDFSPPEKQIEVFKAQIELAIELNLPIIVHNRDSDKDMMDIVSQYCGKGLKAQFHCFNGSLNDAFEYIKMNHFISFTGNITFKNRGDVRSVLEKIGLDNLLLETDSPFMTPVPFRGKRNEPAYVKYVAKKISEIHKVPLEEVAKITSYNAFRLFGIGKSPEINFTYPLGRSLYINVTNRCNADCTFCKRNTFPVISGFNLGMKKSEEPAADEYIKEIGDPKKYEEIVFCGYGEPTIRWEIVKQVAVYVKANGGKTRLNTNGHGNLINHKDITPEMKDLIDVVSISFNSFDPGQYAQLMRLDEKHFFEMINFAKASKPYVKKVVMSVVSLDEVEIEKSRKVVADEIGAEFRVREYF
ncbi:MAG TPA: TatD family hydrolase [Ignavibacteriaceae bacterium]|nr:TatD family hydrolase [Ignavibacteriaceae bacterium]